MGNVPLIIRITIKMMIIIIMIIIIIIKATSLRLGSEEHLLKHLSEKVLPHTSREICNTDSDISLSAESKL